MGLKRATDRLLNRLLMRWSEHVLHDGIWIGAFRPADVAIIGQVQGALALIARYDPVRYRHLKRRIDRIRITPFTRGAAAFVADERMILIDGRSATEASDEVIASWLVHEATHARLTRFGYEEVLRARIERCCIRREIAFARRHSNGEAVIAETREMLGYPDAFWSDAECERRERASETEHAREVGLPLWFVQLAHRLRDVRTGPKIDARRE